MHIYTTFENRDFRTAGLLPGFSEFNKSALKINILLQVPYPQADVGEPLAYPCVACLRCYTQVYGTYSLTPVPNGYLRGLSRQHTTWWFAIAFHEVRAPLEWMIGNRTRAAGATVWHANRYTTAPILYTRTLINAFI